MAPAPQSSGMPPTPQGPLRPVQISEAVTIKELSEKLNARTRDLIKALMQRGIFATINQSLEKGVATELARLFGYEATFVTFEEEAVLEEITTETTEELAIRPPIVTVMGHVDHGKTSLLDAIRDSNVAAREAGQITQHIGAYQVEKKGRRITFLDTPGHEAFTRMRSRGAKSTDVVILVVAADDGVMPQTVEAIHHAKAAKVPIIVAVNKMDLPTANPDRVMQMLSDQELVPEEWGGDTVMVKVSAKKQTGLDELLDLILLTADMLELKSNENRAAAGVVLEAKLDRGRGPVATVLIQHGTLHPGEAIIAGPVHGKVRAMFDDHGARVEEAGPSSPIEILGLQSVPDAGDPFQVVSEAKAREVGSFRQQKLREQTLARKTRLTLNQLYQQIADGNVKELPIVLKGDVQGSVEALSDMLHKLTTDAIKVNVIHSAPGAITESDVLLASASNAIIIGFNVRPERKARDLAEHEKVDLRLHTVIYHVTQEIEAAMQGLLEPTFEEKILGRIEIRQIFKVPKIGAVAGCHVLEGRVTRDSQVRLLRDNVIVYEGQLGSLKRFKEDVSDVRQGYECGLSIQNYQDIKENDVVEAYKMEKVPPKKIERTASRKA